LLLLSRNMEAKVASSSSPEDSPTAIKVRAGIKACLDLAAANADSASAAAANQLLAELEGELQAKDVAIAALKSECARGIANGMANPRCHGFLRDPSLALARDVIVSSAHPASAVSQQQAEAVETQLRCLQAVSGRQKMALRRISSALRQSESQKITLNAELQALRLWKAEAELERAASEAASGSEKRDSGESTGALKEQNSKLESELESAKKRLDTEKEQKQQLVTLLMTDRRKMATLYVEEKRRSDELATILRDEKNKVKMISMELEEESKRSLAMETEVEKYLRQLTKHREDTNSKLMDEARKRHDMEEALKRARFESDHLRQQLSEAHRVAMSQASLPPPPPPPSGPSTSPSGSTSGSTSSAATYMSAGGDIYATVTKPVGSSLGASKLLLKKEEPSLANDNGFPIRSPRGGPAASPSLASSSSTSAAAIGGLKSSQLVTATIKKASAAASGVANVPPPVPPNKPALPLYKKQIS